MILIQVWGGTWWFWIPWPARSQEKRSWKSQICEDVWILWPTWPWPTNGKTLINVSTRNQVDSNSLQIEKPDSFTNPRWFANPHIYHVFFSSHWTGLPQCWLKIVGKTMGPKWYGSKYWEILRNVITIILYIYSITMHTHTHTQKGSWCLYCNHPTTEKHSCKSQQFDISNWLRIVCRYVHLSLFQCWATHSLLSA